MAQLLEAIGPTDTSFTISTTVCRSDGLETAGPNIGQPSRHLGTVRDHPGPVLQHGGEDAG